MGTYVTASGLERKTLQEIRLELEAALKQVFGQDFETSVDSPNGQLISQLSLSMSNLWELAQEVYLSRDPSQATGLSLDFAAALNGLFRKAATACRVDAMLFSLAETATIPAGSQALRTRGNLLFGLDQAVEISRASCEKLLILDDGSAKNTEYIFHFTFGDVTLNNTSSSTTNLAALSTAIYAAGGRTESFQGGLLVYVLDGSVGITGQLPDDFLIYAGQTGSFTAGSVGAQTCEIGELNNIPLSVQDWDKVYNFEAGVPGTDTESDSVLRVRRAQSAQSIKATATDPAIAAHLLNDVTGVTAAKVVSNRKMQVDAQGRPAKSFEALVVGGSDQDVARCIWDNMPSGIEPYGNTSVSITDDAGDNQIISFSRPQAKYLWVKLTYNLYDEEQAPTADEIKAAIVQWAEHEYNMGVDVIPTRILQGLYEGTTGIGLAMAQCAVTDEPTDTPTYGSWADTISIGPAEYAALDASRITLVLET